MSSTAMAALFANGKSPVGLPSVGVAVAYASFAAAGFWVYHVIAEQIISGILTLSVMIQCLSFVLVALKISSTRSAAGISARTLGLSALSLCCRLSSTLFLNGYLPVDASGDWVYQAVDICSLSVVAYLLWQTLSVRRSSYQQSSDTCSVWGLVLGAFCMAVLFHADMNHSFVFDCLWTVGLFLDALAMVPQLWLITKNAGTVEALTSHYIATTVVSRLLSGYFWYLVMDDIACDAFWVEGFNHGSWGILAAHAVHFLLLGDFAYYYAKACLRGTLASGMPLVCGEV